ncbi:YlbF family regulator [Longirhabdus pacifica]|uniref:YlbF family regulator n=1 Tax=Longirhabdus pacifica TaxID=2305227 RepID=UPI001008A0E7|nr:YlbF family regulator [Longirhabdus pacifica]
MDSLDQKFDVSRLMINAYELADMVNHSEVLDRYLALKSLLRNDETIQEAIKELDKQKEKFAEYERFGQYHPDYHKGIQEVKDVEEKVNQYDLVKQFKAVEEELDDLLYSIAKNIAHTVSPTIKVPSNTLQLDEGCSTGGSCSGKCG